MRVDKHIESLLSETEIQEAKADALHIQNSLDSLRQSISQEVKVLIEIKGFNKLKKELGISSRTLSMLSKGEGNATLETISLLSQINHKVPKIFWE